MKSELIFASFVAIIVAILEITVPETIKPVLIPVLVISLVMSILVTRFIPISFKVFVSPAIAFMTVFISSTLIA